mgnify:FL=1
MSSNTFPRKNRKNSTSEREGTIIYTLTARFSHIYDSGGRVSLFSDSHVFSNEIWQRYLAIFDEMILAVRSRPTSQIDKRALYEVTGKGVHVAPLPYFEGPLQFLVKYWAIRKKLKRTLETFPRASLTARLPCPIGFLMIGIIKNKRPYAVEVVGDPWEVFSPEGVKHILRPFLRRFFRVRQRRACRDAIGAIYVSNYLQERYPCKNMSIISTNIQLNRDDYSSRSRRYDNEKRTFSLIFVGTLQQLYKAPDILIKAVSICVGRGYDVRLTLLGDGKYRNYLEKLANELGIKSRVEFKGSIPREEVFRSLDEADLFVLPSKTEGLPRAMLEAMARGLPCIGSTAGGIPEILHEEDVVPPGDADALAEKIMEVLSCPERMSAMSERNLSRAKDYSEDILQKKREEFYLDVREKTEDYFADCQKREESMG